MNYREQRAYLNCEKRIFAGAGKYDIPEIEPVDADLTDAELLGFNYALHEKNPENKILHFYLDDYQFERVWSSPDRYLDTLRRFKAVLTPDFSMYADFPQAVSMFNHYRKQWCGAYWQMNGVTVIPTVGWAEEPSFEWCFDGIPKHSLVSISNIGASKYKDAKGLFLKGWSKAIETLEPKKILLVGKKYPWMPMPDCEVVTLQSPNLIQKQLKCERRA